MAGNNYDNVSINFGGLMCGYQSRQQTQYATAGAHTQLSALFA